MLRNCITASVYITEILWAFVFKRIFLVHGDHPSSRKKAPRMKGQMKIFHVGSHQFWESLRDLLRELWFSYCSSREMPFREWNCVFREQSFEFRELLREYPGTLRELREWLFHSESVFFSEVGVPRLLNIEFNIKTFENESFRPPMLIHRGGSLSSFPHTSPLPCPPHPSETPKRR